MIASRAFSRIHRPLQSSNSYLVFLTATGHLQGYHCFRHLSCINRQSLPKDVQHLMGRDKKKKTVTLVWRPISTRSTSNEDENEVGMVTNPTSSSQSKALNDAEDISVGATATSASHNSCVGDAEIISMVSKEKHALSVEVGASVMHFIRGSNGTTQKSIEEDMGVKIRFPSSKKDDSIVIEGDSLNVITKASEKIQAIIDEAVKSQDFDYSHFISLPLAIHPEFVNKLVRFQSTILGDNDPMDVEGTGDGVSSGKVKGEFEPKKAHGVAVQLKVQDGTDHIKVAMDVPRVSYAPKASKSHELGIDKSIFIKPKTFHLTIKMLKLWNKERVRRATEVLQGVSSEVLKSLDNRPVFLRFKGLDLMRGSRDKAHVLYAPVEEIGNEGRLSLACQVITDAFVEAGLVLEKDKGQKLKLHATLMNSSHRKIYNRMIGKRRSQPFDATQIFEQFESEHWGDYPIMEAHLSQRFLYDDKGYYHCCASIPFPHNNPSTSS